MEGKVISFQKGEYPQLTGLEVGTEVKFTGSAILNSDGESQSLEITGMEFQTEGMADRELRNMTGQKSVGVTPQSNSEDF